MSRDLASSLTGVIAVVIACAMIKDEAIASSIYFAAGVWLVFRAR